ncbi:MAG: acyltransferase family protein [Bacteroidota bacterium]
MLLKQNNGRYLFLDVFRFVSIILMLQGHVFRALLDTTSRLTTWFDIHEFIHGLTAPGFLVSAGLTFGISTLKRHQEYIQLSPVFYKRLGRFSLILLLGYALHLPKLSLTQLMNAGTYYDYISLTQVDVLQCIGITLLFSQLLLFFVKEEKYFLRTIGVMSIAILLLTPLLQNQSFLKSLPLSVAQYLDIYNGSNFPLLPNAVYIFAGMMLAEKFLKLDSEAHIEIFFKKLSLFGIGLALIALAVYFVPMQFYPVNDFWKTSPNFVLIRFGCVVLLLTAVWYLTAKVQSINPNIPLLGKESLFIYIFHLPLIYGSPVNYHSLYVFFGSQMNVLQASIVFIALATFIVYVTKQWHYMKTHRLTALRYIQVGMATTFLYFFFTL